MSDISQQQTPQMTAEYEAIFAQYLEEIDQLHAQMQRDQIEIDRLKAESAAYKAESQRLKAEGALLNTDIQARLSRLGTTVQEKEISPLGYTPEEERVHEALMQAGLLKEVKPRTWENTLHRPMGTIQGKPLSETIIEERR